MNQRSTKGRAALLLAFGLLMILPLFARAQSAERESNRRSPNSPR